MKVENHFARIPVLFLFQYIVYIINHFKTTTKMEDKKLTPRESVELIASMIQTSKRRIAIADMRISVMWAVLSIITAAIYMVLYLSTGNSWYNLIWFAIPIIGYPLTMAMNRDRDTAEVSTYIDRVRNGVWQIVAYIAIMLTIICAIFSICGYSRAWLVMLFYAFIVVGFGAAANGIIYRENSYTVGGIFSILAGFAVIAAYICGIPLAVVWVIPVYILCFLLMFVVPAFIVGRKMKKVRNERA